MGSQLREELSDAELERIAQRLREITHGSSWSRTLATGELILKHFFSESIEEWRSHRRQKEASIRRLARRPECPLGRSALSEAVAVYVARRDLPQAVDALTPSHVAVVLRLPPAERLKLLEKAIAGDWSVRETRAEVLSLKRRAGERRGRPRLSSARAALTRFRSSLDALESGLELLAVATEVDADTHEHLRRTLSGLERAIESTRSRMCALSGPGLRRGSTESVVVPVAARGKVAV